MQLSAERELVLIKVKAPSGEPRSDISNICDIFRARILDVGDESYTLALTGDVGKVGRSGIDASQD